MLYSKLLSFKRMTARRADDLFGASSKGCQKGAISLKISDALVKISHSQAGSALLGASDGSMSVMGITPLDYFRRSEL